MTLDISLYGIVDPQIARGRSLATLAGTAARAGATLIQYRCKSDNTRHLMAEAASIRDALAGTGVPLLINDRVDVALAIGADGVHLGDDDMALAHARRLLGAKAIIGATVKAATEMSSLPIGVCDYACIGGVYQTSHKDNAAQPIGAETFARKLAVTRARLGDDVQIGAIAGITAHNLGALFGAGADGVAVIGAMFGDDDVAAATRALKNAIATARGANG